MNDTQILAAPVIGQHDPSKLSKWEREKQAFRRLLPSLLPTHNGKYVAIHEEQLVGSGADQLELARESYRRYGYVPIYVGLVTDKAEGSVRVPSPRVLRPEERKEMP